MSALTPAESRVDGLRKQGLLQREIAELLSISIRTVHIHCARITRKTGNGERHSAPRYMYFIEASALSLIKVGVSLDVKSRFKQISNHCPVPLKLLGAVATEEARVLERKMLREHIIYRGEWLQDTPKLRRAIAKHLTA